MLIPLGDDFRYMTAEEWDAQYTNYQTIFDYVNSHPELNAEMAFGTLQDYFDSVRNASLLRTRDSEGLFKASPNNVLPTTSEIELGVNCNVHFCSRCLGIFSPTRTATTTTGLVITLRGRSTRTWTGFWRDTSGTFVDAPLLFF